MTPPMNTQWFVIHTLSGQEQKVKENIEKRIKAEEMGDFIKEVLVPMEKVAEVRGGKKTVSTRKLHPGYVYIDLALLDDNRRILDKPWYFIRETPGIIGFVRRGPAAAAAGTARWPSRPTKSRSSRPRCPSPRIRSVRRSTSRWGRR